MTDLTAEEARNIWGYNPETGDLTWEITKNRQLKGSKAGIVSIYGYLTVHYKKRYRKNRLVWLIVTGSWPVGQIDHINGDRTDDRFSNLRECSQNQNMWNRRVHKNNKLGIKGVHKNGNGYIAYIMQFRHRIYLGYFKTVNEAKNAYDEAAKKFHGEFARF